MRAALYARVSTERQAERGTIGSQLRVLREHLAGVGDELVGEYVDDGHSGARLDRPGLDALRDAAEAGLMERVWCLSADRLARAYAYQVLVLDELARFGVTVAFTDSPGLAPDDPQATLLTQVQGVIAEYERAKISERYRRGKLFRARAGEVLTWKTCYGYRRVPRSTTTGQAHLEIYEPEAEVVRRIFTERAAGTTIREICRQLNADRVPSPTGKPTWGHSTLSRLLRNEAYVGRVYYNRSESVPDRRPTRRSRQVPRNREEWIPVDCPRIVSDELFQAAGSVLRRNPSADDPPLQPVLDPQLSGDRPQVPFRLHPSFAHVLELQRHHHGQGEHDRHQQQPRGRHGRGQPRVASPTSSPPRPYSHTEFFGRSTSQPLT